MRMRKLIFYFLFPSLLFSCSTTQHPRDDCFRYYTNHYSTFDELVDGWDKIDKNVKESKPNMFPVENEHWHETYCIYGGDWCVCNSLYASHSEHPTFCDYLEDRIAFAKLETNGNNLKCAVIYTTVFDKFDEATYHDDYDGAQEFTTMLDNPYLKVGLSFNHTIVCVAEFQTVEAYNVCFSLVKEIVFDNYTN